MCTFPCVCLTVRRVVALFCLSSTDEKGSLSVFCRVRPFIREELEVGEYQPCVEMTDMNTVSVTDASGNTIAGLVDFTLDGTASQEDVFSSVEDAIDWTLSGHESCILTYGQKSAGKVCTFLDPHACLLPVCALGLCAVKLFL